MSKPEQQTAPSKSKVHGFYRPGIRLYGWLDKYGIHLNYPWLPLVPAAFVGLAMILLKVAPGWLVICLSVLIWGVQSAQSYMQACKRAGESSIRRKVGRRIWTRVAEWKQFEKGFLAALGRLVFESQASTDCDAQRAKAKLENLQREILKHIVEMVRQYLGLESRNILSANWAMIELDADVSGTGTVFRVAQYDRSMSDRMEGCARPHRIEQGTPGASQAILSNRTTCVPDTTSAEMREFFPADCVYKGIVSIPVSLGRDLPIGVLNIDSTQPGLLREDLALIVEDLAYLVGLCEAIGDTWQEGTYEWHGDDFARDPGGDNEPSAELP